MPQVAGALMPQVAGALMAPVTFCGPLVERCRPAVPA